MRLDKHLAEIYQCSRHKANDMINQGFVLVNSKKITKPSHSISTDDCIIILQDAFISDLLYCSRGALKLQKFLDCTSPNNNIVKDSNKAIESKLTLFNMLQDSLLNQNQKNDVNKAISIKQDIHHLIKNQVLLDVGASSGGFTQMLLAKNARFVIAQDVGSLQLDSNLRNNSRVLSLENIDIREFSKNKALFLESLLTKSYNKYQYLDSNNLDKINLRHTNKSQSLKYNLAKTKLAHANKNNTYTTKPFSMLTCDVSFISLRNIVDSLYLFSKCFLLLFKPQFEVGVHAKRDKNGIVKDKRVIIESLITMLYILDDYDVKLLYVEKSQVKGKSGSEEFFIFCQF